MFGLDSIFGDGAGEAASIREGAANKASEEYARLAEQARKEITEGEKTSRGDVTKYYTEAQGYGEPYRQAGTTSLNSYMASLGLGTPEQNNKITQSFRESPGYQFALQQGVNARQASAAAKGQLLSGGLLKELTQYGQGLADQEYGNWQNRLQQMTEFGGQAAESAANRSQQTGSNLGGITERAASQRASSLTGQASTAADAALAAGEARASGVQAQGQGIGNLISGGLKLGAGLIGGL